MYLADQKLSALQAIHLCFSNAFSKIIGMNPALEIPLLANQDLTPMLSPSPFETACIGLNDP